MSNNLKKQITIGVGVVIGTAIFKKFVSPTLTNILPSKAV